MMIPLIRSIDRNIGNLLVQLFPRRGKAKISPKRILLIRLWALGDSTITLVLIKALRKLYPKSEVYVLARDRNRVVYENQKNIKRILSIPEVFKYRFDLVFDCEPYLNISAIIAALVGKVTVGFSHGLRARLYNFRVVFRKDQHMVQNYLDMIRVLGNRYDADHLEMIHVNDPERKKVQDFLKKNRIGKIAGITAGAAETATKSRMWPIERFAESADYLSGKGFQIMFVGSRNEEKIIKNVQRLMKGSSFSSFEHFNLQETIYLIEKCSIFLSNDTGPMHIAAAQGVPTIGLFGANTPELWCPYGKKNISIYKRQDCSPCIDNTTGKIQRCRKNYRCMSEISVADVKKAIDSIIK